MERHWKRVDGLQNDVARVVLRIVVNDDDFPRPGLLKFFQAFESLN